MYASSQTKMCLVKTVYAYIIIIYGLATNMLHILLVFNGNCDLSLKRYCRAKTFFILKVWKARKFFSPNVSFPLTDQLFSKVYMVPDNKTNRTLYKIYIYKKNWPFVTYTLAYILRLIYTSNNLRVLAHVFFLLSFLVSNSNLQIAIILILILTIN